MDDSGTAIYLYQVQHCFGDIFWREIIWKVLGSNLYAVWASLSKPVYTPCYFVDKFEKYIKQDIQQSCNVC